MVPSIQVGRVRVKGGNHAIGVALVALLFGMSGCSSVPDSLNPTKWYSWAISDTPDDTDEDLADVAPQPIKGDYPNVNGPVSPRRQVADGLAGDTENSNYAPAVPRDITPTKPLVHKNPNEAQARMVAAAEAPAAQSAATQTPGGPQTARANLAPSAPPATAPDMTPPGRPDIPDRVVPAKKNGLMDHYHQRLMESGTQTVATATPAVTGGAGGTYGSSAYQPVHLVPPKSYASGTLAVTTAAAAGPASSFLLASLDFQNGSAKLSPSDIEALREVARQYRRTGGTVRILGLGTAQRAVSTRTVVIGGGASYAGIPATPMARAEAVSNELARLGVPASKIMVGAVAPGTPAATDGAAARVYLDM